MNKKESYLKLSEIEKNEMIKTDVCIVGGGAAGISLALEFCNQNFNVLLIESGSTKFSHRNQKLSSNKSIGIPSGSVMFSIRRQFGGTTVTWTGRCRPLDEIDFIKRQWIENSGWPFNKSDLDPYYIRGQKICGLGGYDYSLYSDKSDNWFDRISNQSDLEGKAFMFSRPFNFATEHGPEIEKSPNINILLNSNAVRIDLDSNGKSVKAIQCRTINGKTFFVSSKIFILAAGGLEITRLLLSSNQVQKTGIGNNNDLVGRYYMDHPHFWSGAFTNPKSNLGIEDDDVLTYGKEVLNRKPSSAIGLKEQYLFENKLTNAAGFFINRPWHKIQKEYFSPAGIAYKNISEILGHHEYPSFKLLMSSVLILFKNLKDSIQHLLNIWISRKEKSNWVGIISQIEQVPNRESRVTLSSKLNSIGQAKIIIDWQLTDQDLENIEKYNSLLKKNFDTLGVPFDLFPADLNKNNIPSSIFPGKHHMGTTRMNNDPELGVVDENCKVHDISNLYISSGSVFPTAGQANPTLTIIALALKLADHIKENGELLN